MCVVLGVGVISVFDAVAFLACVHRVSSADPEELELEDFEVKLEAEELGLELEPLDLGLLEYELEDLFSWFP